MSNFVDQPLDKMMNKKSVTTAIKALQQTVSAKPSARLDYLSEITSDFGDVVYGRFIGPQNDSGTEPTDSGFSGVFLCAYSQVMSDSTQNAWLAYVSSGSVLFSVGENGIYQNRLTDGYTHIANDGTTYRKGLMGMQNLSGRTAPSFGITYSDNSSGSELLTNGGAESASTTGWTVVSGTWNANTTGSLATAPYSGSYCFLTTTGTGEMKQAVNITGGSILQLQGAMGNNAGETSKIQLDFYTGAAGAGTLVSSYIITTTSGPWIYYNRIVSSPTTCASVVVRLINSGAGNDSCFDALSLKVNPAANYLGFEPADGKLVSNQLDSGDILGQVPVGAMKVLRVEETKDKVTTAVVAYAGVGVDVGTHYYIVTFVDAYGETDADLGQAASAVVAATANDQVNLTTIPLGKWGTTSRRIYRTKVGGSSSDPTAYFLLTTIGDNTTTTYSDITPDASLSATTIPTVNTTGSRPVWPRSATVQGLQVVPPSGKAITVTNNQASYPTSTIYNCTAAATADGDEYQIGVTLEAGTYTLYTDGGVLTSGGKFDYYCDGVSQFTGQDWYAAASAYSQKSGTITVTTSGYHLITIRANGKNAASTNYVLRWSQFTFTPSAY